MTRCATRAAPMPGGCRGRHDHRSRRVRRHAARLPLLADAAAWRAPWSSNLRGGVARGVDPQGAVTATTPSLIGARVVALSSAVIGLGLLGDTLIYAVLPLYHAEWGISLFMVGVLLSLN